MMELAFAGFLVGLAGLSVPIILHFLKHRPTKRTPFPSLRFLQTTLARRARNNKLRKWIVLLLRCCCLSALVLAFCMPYLPRFARQPDDTIVVLWDRSFSMQAEPYADLLRKQCLKEIDKADATHPVLLGGVSDKVVWSGKFTANAQELRQAFDSMESSEGASSFENALRLADARLAIMPGETKHIVLITDRQALPWKSLQWERKLSPGVQLRVISPQTGGFVNASIKDLTLENPYLGPERPVAVTARLQNFSERALDGVLIARLDGTEVFRENTMLAPLSESTCTFDITGNKEHQGLEVELEVDDELAVDNHRWLALNPTPLPTVCATADPSGKTDFLQMAFNPTRKSASADWMEWDDALATEQLAQADLLIVRDGISLLSPAGKQFLETLEQGGSAIAIWNDTPDMRNLLNQFGITSELLPTHQTKELDFIDFDHPVFKPFLDAEVGGFFSILFFDPPVLSLPEGAQILTAFQDGTPAVVEVPVGQGRLLVVASSMDRRHTDWPSHATFLPFWREVMDYCKRDEQTDLALRVSATPIYLPGLQQATRLGSDEHIEIEQSRLPAETGGNYLLNADTNPRIVSINLPPEESDPAQLDGTLSWEKIISNEPARATLVSDQPMDQGKSFWHALFVIAILAALGEMLIANRTVL